MPLVKTFSRLSPVRSLVASSNLSLVVSTSLQYPTATARKAQRESSFFYLDDRLPVGQVSAQVGDTGPLFPGGQSDGSHGHARQFVCVQVLVTGQSLFDVVENRPGRRVSLGRDHDGILEGGVFQGDFNQVAVRTVQDAAEGRVQVTVKVLQFASAQVVSESKGVVRLDGHGFGETSDVRLGHLQYTKMGRRVFFFTLRQITTKTKKLLVRGSLLRRPPSRPSELSWGCLFFVFRHPTFGSSGGGHVWN